MRIFWLIVFFFYCLVWLGGSLIVAWMVNLVLPPPATFILWLVATVYWTVKNIPKELAR